MSNPRNDTSILVHVKNHLGPYACNTDFDAEIIDHINGVFDDLRQLGVGPADGFVLENADQTWADYFGSTRIYESAKEYVWMKVKLIFDPPASASALAAFERRITERETRLRDQVDHYEE